VIQRSLGPRSVSTVGLVGMPMSIEGRPDAERSMATIHAALDAGVTLIDTADAYHLLPGEVGSQRGADRPRPEDLRRRHR
jgi:aryl-alcohol dehydrogenase-like predicted oxidoreductase